MKRILLISVILFPVLCPARNNVQKYIEKELVKVPELQSSALAIYAEDASGNVVASFNPDMPLHTASILKTVSTGLAYQILGSDYRFTTRVAYNGTVDGNGSLAGDIYILGGADPTIGWDKDISCPSDSIFAIWAEGLKNAGIKSISGRIIGDDRIFSDEVIPGAWSYGNVSSTSGCGTCGLPFAINRSVYSVSPGEKVGEPAKVSLTGNGVPDLLVVNDIVTAKASSSRKNVAYHTVRFNPSIQFYGTYPLGAKERTVTVPNQYGAWTCAYEFYKYLLSNGFDVAGYDEVTNLTRRGESIPGQEDMPVISETKSPELKDIVYVTNRISQNFLAETIYRIVGKTLLENRTGKSEYKVSYKKTHKAVHEFMEDRGLDMTGYKQADGSGLTRKNCISPRFFSRFYSYMLSCNDFESYLKSFPQPGEYGTLEDVLKDADGSVKSIIHAKSGSLDDVRSYAGYVESSKGYIRFAIIVNNISCPVKTIQPYVEKFLEELAVYARKH